MKIFNQRKNVLMYTVDKEFYRNDLSISIQNGEVVVCVPWYLTRNQIQRIVDEKREWILNKLTKTVETEKIENRTANILGKEYNINIIYKNLKRPELNLKSNEIEICIPSCYKNRNICNMLEVVLNKMYLKIAEAKMEEIMEKTRIKLGIAPEEYIIQKMDKKLADCADMNKIIINPEIMKYKQEYIEYIVMHQFCHLKYKTHSKGFYKMIENNFKNYKKIEKELKSLETEF